MPIHIAPYFRNKELAMEAAGLILPLNSDGYNQIVAAENVGLKTKFIPSVSFDYNGKHFDSKE
jgi:hypothetical protein